MRNVWRLIVCALCAMWATVGSAAAQGDCDRACLRTMLDRYLSAVIAHDPARAPLLVGFRQTENAINTKPGDGVWKTVTGLDAVQRRYFDAVTGQAGYFGTVEEAPVPSPWAVVPGPVPGPGSVRSLVLRPRMNAPT